MNVAPEMTVGPVKHNAQFVVEQPDQFDAEGDLGAAPARVDDQADQPGGGSRRQPEHRPKRFLQPVSRDLPRYPR